LADIRASRQQAVELPLGDAALASIDQATRRLGEAARNEVATQGETEIAIDVRAHVRYAGTDNALIVPAGSAGAMRSAFETAHRARFGFIDHAKELVVEAVSIEAVGRKPRPVSKAAQLATDPIAAPTRRTRFFSGGAWHDASV